MVISRQRVVEFQGPFLQGTSHSLFTTFKGQEVFSSQFGMVQTTPPHPKTPGSDGQLGIGFEVISLSGSPAPRTLLASRPYPKSRIWTVLLAVTPNMSTRAITIPKTDKYLSVVFIWFSFSKVGDDRLGNARSLYSGIEPYSCHIVFSCDFSHMMDMCI